MRKNNLKININKEDFVLNDYLYTWDYFGERPNKINLYQTIDFEDFEELISNLEPIEGCSLVEVYPIGEDNLINKKIFVKLNENVFLSYMHFDTESEESFINEISILYRKEGKEFVNELIDKLYDTIQTDELEDNYEKSNTYSISIGPNGLEENSIKFLDADLENIDLYFNDDTIKQVNKLSKYIKNSKKGLSIIHGERGTGKSTLIKYLSTKIDKKFIFIPSSMFETTIVNPDFRSFINKNPDSVIILDDSDIYFSEIYSKSNIFTNNILQLVDGLDSDSLKLHIIAVLNLSDVGDIDHILLDCNNLTDIIHVQELEVEKIKDLNKHLKKKTKVKKPTKLIDILKNRNFSGTKNEIGFL
jgi:hypothetical protein